MNYQSLKSQTGKFPYGTASLVTIIRNQPDISSTKPTVVTKWAYMMYKKVWKYYWVLDEKEFKVLENKADELTITLEIVVT